MQDIFKISGSLVINKYNESGELIDVLEHKNLIVQTGRELLATRLLADERPAITINSGSANGTTATLQFNSQPVVPYEVGSSITVSGCIPAQFNGTFRVVSVSQTEVTYDLSTAPTTITTPGQINSLFNGTIKTMRVGTTSTTPNITDTSLYTEIGSANLFSSSLLLEDNTVSAVYIALFPSGVATTTPTTLIQEAGMFNNYNKMLCRTVFPPVSKTAGESLEIFWKITIA
jgi:hypothetical protein